jgi:RHS repeat-associated protein
VDDPLIALYRDPQAPAKEFYWVTDGSGRQLAVGLEDGSLGGADRTNYFFNGGKFAGGTENATSFDATRFESTIAPKLSYFRNRIYDQETGRWTQEDPIGVAGGLNLYQFNGNNPVAFTDPFGLKKCRQAGNCVQGDGGVEEALDHAEAQAARIPFGNPQASRVLADPLSSGLQKLVAMIEMGASLPGPLGMAGGASKGASALSSWHKATFGDEAASAAYHLKKHGGGRTLEEYTDDAIGFFDKNRRGGVPMTAKDGTAAVRITSPGGGPGGIFTEVGKIITFWYK